MLSKSEQILFNEPLSGPSGTVYTSKTFRLEGYTFFTLIATLAATPTGTSPTLTWALQSSADGISFTTVGAALAAMTPSNLVQATVYGTGTTQGAISGPFFRVIGTLGGTNAVFPGVFAEVVAHA